MNLIKFYLLICILAIQANLISSKSQKSTLTLAERIDKLQAMSSMKSIIRLDSEKFRTFIGRNSLPRNYSFVVMMTALSSRRQCQICRHAHDEYLIVANSWRYYTQSLDRYQSKVFFGLVDFDEAQDIFNQLNIQSAPVFIYFSEKGKIRGADQMDIQRYGYGAEAIGKWIAEKSDIHIRIIRPPNYSGTFVLIGLGLLFGSILYVKRNNLDFIFNRTSWAFASLLIVFTMTSGQMWNNIRGPPLINRSSKGVNFIHGSSGGQYILETYIVFIFNSAIAFGVFLMNEAMKGKGNHKKRKITAIIGLGFAVIFFSLLLSVFRSKAQGYPYSLLFK